MKFALPALLVALGCVSAALGQSPSKADLAAAEATLRKLDAAWAQTKSVDAWLSYYAEDAVVLPPNDKVANGKEAARKAVAELLGLPGLQLTWTDTRVHVAAAGDLGYVVGV